MKRYFDREDFISFLNLLEDNKITNLYTESGEDGSISEYHFMKTEFCGNTIILYDHPYCCVGIIQDTPPYDWEDCAEGVFEDLESDGDYKVFIE